MTPVRFTIIGVPEAKGSAKVLPIRRRFPFNVRSVKELLACVVVTSANPHVKRWQAVVASAARAALGGVTLELTGAIRLEASFYLPPPIKMPRNRAGLPIVRPDLDKLSRAILDALTGVFYHDDEQVIDLLVCKRYSETVGEACVEVCVTPIETTVLPLFERSLHAAFPRADAGSIGAAAI